MTDICLNPECDNEMDTIGVCMECVFGTYAPRDDGVEVDR